MSTKLDLNGEAYLALLVRRQLLLACAASTALLAVLIAIPLLTEIAPLTTPGHGTLRGDAWSLLALAAFPATAAIAAVYASRSDEAEDVAIGIVDVASLPVPPGDVPRGSTSS